jgi:RNA polymerase-binding transcription factor DksA
VKARDLDRWKEKLLALKAEILAEGDIAIEPVRKDEVRVTGDDDEAPLTEMNQVIASKRNRSRTDVMGRVVAALSRLESAPDDFGLCKECGEAIGKRLEALPYVELCVQCQEETDGARDFVGRRRNLTDFR